MRILRNGKALAICLAMIAGSAWADGDGGFVGQLAGSAVGEHVAGVASGGAPWTVAKSEFSVSPSGRIEVEIRRLLISSGPATNTVGPVTMVSASLTCNDVVAGATAAVPLSTAGDAAIHDTVTVPARCIAPALLIRIAATTAGPVANGPFIAVNAVVGGGKGDGGRDQ